MIRQDSDLFYFSVVMLIAVFAMPAIAGPCLALHRCPTPVVADCHDEEGKAAESCCCDARAVPDATRETLKQKDSVWLVASHHVLAAGGSSGTDLRAAFVPPPLPTRGQPLFLLKGSFLI